MTQIQKSYETQILQRPFTKITALILTAIENINILSPKWAIKRSALSKLKVGNFLADQEDLYPDFLSATRKMIESLGPYSDLQIKNGKFYAFHKGTLRDVYTIDGVRWYVEATNDIYTLLKVNLEIYIVSHTESDLDMRKASVFLPEEGRWMPYNYLLSKK